MLKNDGRGLLLIEDLNLGKWARSGLNLLIQSFTTIYGFTYVRLILHSGHVDHYGGNPGPILLYGSPALPKIYRKCVCTLVMDIFSENWVYINPRISRLTDFFSKKIYKILVHYPVHYICGPEKSLQGISRSPSYGFSLLSGGMPSGTTRDRHVFFKLKNYEYFFVLKPGEKSLVCTLARSHSF